MLLAIFVGKHQSGMSGVNPLVFIITKGVFSRWFKLWTYLPVDVF
jgi:hypothetical protein